MFVAIVALGLLAASPGLASSTGTGIAPANASWTGKAPGDVRQGKRPGDVRQGTRPGDVRHPGDVRQGTRIARVRMDADWTSRAASRSWSDGS